MKEKSAPEPSGAEPAESSPNVGDLINEGLAFQQAGKIAQAESAYRRVLILDPGHAEALALLGMIAGQTGRLQDAVGFFQRALKRSPRNPDIHHNLGETWFHLGQYMKALECFRRAVECNPNHIEAYRRAADAALEEAGRREAARRWFEAADLKRGAIHFLLAAGKHTLETGDRVAAAAEFNRAVELDPKNAEAWAQYGAATIKPYPSKAVPALRRAIELNPTKAWVHGQLANALAYLRRDDEAHTAWRAARSAPDFVESWAALTQFEILPLYKGGDRQEILALHREWGNAVMTRRQQPKRRFKNTRDSERQIRIGYVSPDFRVHSVSFFFAPLLSAHNREHFKVYCYSGVPELGEDQMTRWLKTHASEWRNIAAHDDEAVLRRIQDDQIDILIDLAGHTANSRLRVFAAKPAPVLASWLGYPATTGLPTVDWRITDAVVDPPGAEEFYTEGLMRLDGGFLCFQALDDSPPVSPLPALKNDGIVFGSFNNQLKINAQVITVWAGILRAAPNSRLVIKSELVRDEGVAARLQAGFAAEGVDPDRIELRTWMSGMREHLSAYGDVDIALDPFPYNGTTTTCEALWMGLPVVTLIGDHHAARVGFDILSRVGLGRLAAPNIASYIAIAKKLSEDREELAELRAGLRDRLQNSSLCDAPRFAREFESALRTAWRQWCGSKDA